jgi:hypothetical protein
VLVGGVPCLDITTALGFANVPKLHEIAPPPPVCGATYVELKSKLWMHCPTAILFNDSVGVLSSSK